MRPGQFWAVQLTDGSFGALRILGVPAFGEIDRVGQIVGVMDWTGPAEPTSDELAGCKVLMRASCRHDAVSMNGGRILGLRPLDLDAIVPADPTSMDEVWGRHVWGSRAVVGAVERALQARTTRGEPLGG